MGNFFGEIAHRAGDLVSYPVKVSKDLVTHPKKGWNELTHLYSHNEHEDQRLFQQGFGIHGWVGKHPQETAAAVVATIFGGWAAWGAYGAGAAGGAMGAAGGGAGSGTIAAGTAIGQTVPATPAMISGTAGAAGSGSFATGAGATYAASATPSYSILAGSGYGVGGSYATTLGGEASVGNTGLSTSTNWMDYAKKGYQAYNSMKNGGQQQGSQQQSQPQSPESRQFHSQLLGQMMNTNAPNINVQAPVNNNEMNQVQPVQNNLSGSAFQNQY